MSHVAARIRQQCINKKKYYGNNNSSVKTIIIIFHSKQRTEARMLFTLDTIQHLFELSFPKLS